MNFTSLHPCIALRPLMLALLFLGGFTRAQAQCSPDMVAPTCVAPANLTVSCEQFDPSLFNYGPATVADNCCLDPNKVYLGQAGLTHTANYAQFDTLCLRGTLTRLFKAYDCTGNSSICSQKIVVNYNQEYAIRFPDDVIVQNANPQSVYGQPVFFQEDCELTASSFSDEIFANAPGFAFSIERTWTVINWCTYNPALPLIQVPNPQPSGDPNAPQNLAGPIVSAAGTAFPWAPTIANLLPWSTTPTNFSSFYSANANGYRYTQHINVVTADFTIVKGKVFADVTPDCSLDSLEVGLVGWTLQLRNQVNNQTQTVQTNALGDYIFILGASDTLMELSLLSNFNLPQSCPNTFSLQISPLSTTTQDIPVVIIESCPLLSTGLATPILRRCFPGYYMAQVCNMSYLPVENAYVDVKLDNYLLFQFASLPHTILPDNTYRFELGTIDGGDCIAFPINFQVSCDAPLGYTHCSELYAYPDSLCSFETAWTGANLRLRGVCENNETVKFILQNTGAGDMATAQDFVVVEDVIVYAQGNVQLAAGEEQEISMPANGATWRLQSMQVPNHPWGGNIAVAVEGCGGLNNVGLVNFFGLNDRNPFTYTDCRENVGSYDPNDKQVFPRGYGDNHFIEANTDLEYLIRFQNTGTDTAFTVVVVDTLSAHLDPATVRPLASSHPYSFSLIDGHVLQFRFDNILLPDSFVNEPASNGFLKFSVQQKANNPDGTRIENRAGIYFDFNDPIITNTVFNVIGKDFVLVKVDETPEANQLSVFPNPALETVEFQLKHAQPSFRFQLHDQLGRMVREDKGSGSRYHFERKGLPSGIYYFKLFMDNNTEITGKILLK
jgi:uncharacterized repeat protein (TIGR01451 family)